jgi:hypothetical protein
VSLPKYTQAGLNGFFIILLVKLAGLYRKFLKLGATLSDNESIKNLSLFN